MNRKIPVLLVSMAGLLFLAGCVIGPKYHTPTALTPPPPAFKEVTPDNVKTLTGWKTAEPSDSVLRGKWWEQFHDPELNALEEQVNISNQTIAAAADSFLASRALVREAKAGYFPTITTAPAISRTRGVSVATNKGTTTSTFDLPFDPSYAPDVFGRIRQTVAGQNAVAQASAATLENTRLIVQANLAIDYFQLRNQDALKQLLDSTVVAYQQSLDLTRALYETGIDSPEPVGQAETQLESAQSQDSNARLTRAQFEHAIAVLIGKAPSEFSIPQEVVSDRPPAIPFGVPSQLLERRPDIATSERTVAQANAQIGIAQIAFYPNITISGLAGFEAGNVSNWFTWPTRIWSVGPSLTETIFEGGLRRATVKQFKATYDEDVANYRETVLTAFQQVEDNLSGLRILAETIQLQDAAVTSAQNVLAIATDRYRLGIDPYLNVLNAQTTLLTNQQNALGLHTQELTTTVSLIQALGGGWDTSQVPTPQQIAAKVP